MRNIVKECIYIGICCLIGGLNFVLAVKEKEPANATVGMICLCCVIKDIIKDIKALRRDRDAIK